LKLRAARNGYLYCNIRVNRKPRTVKPHRLVMELFKGIDVDRPEVNHIDGNKRNNQLSNLEWVTSSENKLHALRLGLKVNPFGATAHGFKGVVEVLDKEGNVIDTLSGDREIKQKGYTSCGVSSVITGRQNTHRGNYFRRRTYE